MEMNYFNISIFYQLWFFIFHFLSDFTLSLELSIQDSSQNLQDKSFYIPYIQFLVSSHKKHKNHVQINLFLNNFGILQFAYPKTLSMLVGQICISQVSVKDKQAIKIWGFIKPLLLQKKSVKTNYLFYWIYLWLSIK